MRQDKKFEWSDELIINLINAVAGNAYVDIDKFLSDFKASHSIDVGRDAEGKDWEIISYRDLNRNIWQPFDKTGNIAAIDNPANCTIHSVLRVKDSIVFTCGDNSNIGYIQRFEIIEGKMFAFSRSSRFTLEFVQPISKLPPEPIPLFKTEDGKNIYKGDKYFFVDLGLWVIGEGIMRSAPTNPDYFNMYKHFSTREKAIEYVTLNKPCLSVEEILDYVDIGGICAERLKQLAQTKIKL